MINDERKRLAVDSRQRAALPATARKNLAPCSPLSTIYSPLPIILCLMLLSGCGSRGPETVAVSGVVLLDDKPVVGAAVLFVPNKEGWPASGETDTDGKFQLTTFRDRSGVLVGSYAVTVTKVSVSGVGTKDGLPDPSVRPAKIEWIVPEKYSRTDSSGLAAEVKRDGNSFVFRLAGRT